MSEISGMIAVYKPGGWTSFDVVAKLRGIMKTKKIGHGGTLDPMAEGVLPVFVGKAARACDILPDRRKCYRAGFQFGLSTDTEDITGKVLSQSGRPVSRQEIEELLPDFIGTIPQVPPMYSAVKIGGKKLCELAREGRTVEREPRQVTVRSIVLEDYDPVTRQGIMDIDCEKGTYVRSLIRDMGERLGSGGTMTSLLRTYSGGFGLSDCLSLETIAKSVSEQGAQSVLMPVDRAFAVYDELHLDERLTVLYKNGVRLRTEQVGTGTQEGTYRVYGGDGCFLGLGHFAGGCLRSLKNFFV